jgi:putative ABC transport system permease protein
MRLLTLGVRNVTRSRFRVAMTVLGVAFALVAFMLIRTALSSWTAAADFAAKDRVVSRHKVTFIMTLPYKYLEDVRAVPGVKAAALSSWFGGKDPKHPNDFFGTIAVQPASMLEIYDEFMISPEQKQSWFENRRGALVGDMLAKKLGWKVGDTVTLGGTIYPGEWQFEISGIYTATRRSVDRTTFFFHYDYLNEWSKKNQPTAADQLGWVVSRVASGERAADVAKRIDSVFDSRDIQTLSQDERSFNTSFLGMLSAILTALDIVSIVILAIMMLILGNTMAMGVRERTHEYGVLRAIGFLPKHLATFVLGEAVTVGFLGGLVGLAVGYPLVEKGIGRFLEENMPGIFPFFRVSSVTAFSALGLAILLGLLAAVIPAYQAARLNVVSALRKVG